MLGGGLYWGRVLVILFEKKDLTFPFETSVLSPSLLMLKQRFSNLADNL